jgi:predicted outer membrane repeat protein
VIDGFTITRGFSDATVSVPTNHGCGMYIDSQAPYLATGVRVANCTFSSNASSYASARGVGLYLYRGDANTVVSNCVFVGNTAAITGAGLCSYRGSPKILLCTFRGNSTAANGYGGGASLYGDGLAHAPTVAGCTFAGNVSDLQGGALYVANNCSLSLSDSVFVNNRTVQGAGGGAFGVYFTSLVDMNNCIVSSNAAYRGGAFYVGNQLGGINYPCRLSASNSVFAGNFDREEGGVLYADGASTSVFVNCSFIGNKAYRGGAIRLKSHAGTTALLKNCTFTGNDALPSQTGGSVINVTHGGIVGMTNCIVWGNTAYEWHSDSSTNSVAYTDLRGGLAGITNIGSSVVLDGGGNLNTNPLFADEVTGTWTANGVYNADTFKTTLTDTNASWTPGVHAGRTVEVKANDICQFVITANSATTLTVWANVARAASGDAYRIVDLHEKSRGGRWTPLGWVVDTVDSPCIDAGDGSSYALEPTPNGRRINMGRYGNTVQASLTWLPAGTLLIIR